ncbi:hypothetical protein BH23ACT2_BH23ACT2_25730 [soil metagenome]
MLAADHGAAWADLFKRGYLVVEVAPTAVTARWWLSDPDRADATPTPVATFRTDLDRPGRLVAVDEAGSAESPDTHRGPLGRSERRRAKAPPVEGRPAGVHRHEPRLRRRRGAGKVARFGVATAAAFAGWRWTVRRSRT